MVVKLVGPMTIFLSGKVDLLNLPKLVELVRETEGVISASPTVLVDPEVNFKLVILLDREKVMQKTGPKSWSDFLFQRISWSDISLSNGGAFW